MKKKILVIIQNISKAQEHEWFVEFINRDRFEFHFLLINGKQTYMEEFLHAKKVPVYHLQYRKKSDLISLVLSIYRLLRQQKFQVVHAHLFEATLAGLTAARLAGVPSRIYTRHHSDYHHVWFPGAVKYDRYNNKLATAIIAISKNVQNILVSREQVPVNKVHLVHHGIDMLDYEPGAVSDSRVGAIRAKYNIHGSGPVIGAISRFTYWKGLQHVIPAFRQLLETYPDAVLVLANAKGDYFDEIMNMLKPMDIARYRVIPFENDVAALYKTFDCFVHVPISATVEAFGQTYLEALASGIPSVFTLSGVAPEFIIDGKHAMVVPYCDEQAIHKAVDHILRNKEEMAKMIAEGYESVKKNFDIHVKINKLEMLYSDF